MGLLGFQILLYLKGKRKKIKIYLLGWALETYQNVPGTVAHTCNPSTLGGQGRRIIWGQEFKTSLATWENPVSNKNTEKKISQGWWHVLVVPATWKAEAGELLEPGRWRLQWAKIAPLHSSVGDKTRLHLKKKKKHTKMLIKWFLVVRLWIYFACDFFLLFSVFQVSCTYSMHYIHNQKKKVSLKNYRLCEIGCVQ